VASYVFCRVRDERYYKRNETPPKIMRRTPMVGVGARGGTGLFAAKSGAGADGANYDTVFAGVTKYNKRSWTSATREDYRLVVDRILNGEVVHRVD
jgi:hypothetical protein